MPYQQEIENLIKSLNLPHKLVVSYALACAKSVNKKEHKPTAEALKCIELVEKWLEDDKSVTNQELLETANAAVNAGTRTTYGARAATYAATYAAANAAHAAADAAYAAYSAAHAAANAAFYATSDVDYEKGKIKYKDLLFETIKIRYGELGISLISR
jgi:hypothetical protein